MTPWAQEQWGDATGNDVSEFCPIRMRVQYTTSITSTDCAADVFLCHFLIANLSSNRELIKAALGSLMEIWMDKNYANNFAALPPPEPIRKLAAKVVKREKRQPFTLDEG